MPRRDGTGPTGRGASNGRDIGGCNGANAVRYGAGLALGLARGLGFGCKRGFNNKFSATSTVSKTQKESLQEQKELLESRLEIISKQLES